MSTPAGLGWLITSFIGHARERRRREFRRQLEQRKAEAIETGRIKTGMYIADVDRHVTDELQSRVSAWIAITRRMIVETSTPWTPAFAADLHDLLEAELARDETDLRLFWQGAIPIGTLEHEVDLSWAMEQGIATVDDELALAVLAYEQTRIPVDALLSAPRYHAVDEHWRKAHAYAYGERRDAENAVKEAVSAVEALVRIVISDTTATLGDGIKRLKRRDVVHGALLHGLEEIWRYANNVPGVRHGGGRGSALHPPEVKYVLTLAEAALALLLSHDVT